MQFVYSRPARHLAGRLVLAIGAALTALLPAFAAQAEPLTKVRYTETIRSLMFTPTYVALARGYFKDAGLDVHMNTAQGNDKTMSALLTGSTDIVLLGPEAVIYVNNSESPEKPKIIASLVARGGFLLVGRDLKADPQTFKWAELKGKTVMAYRPGSTPDVFLNTVLQRNHLQPGTDLKIVNNIGVTARMGAWIAGQTDYGIFAEPEASMIEREGQGRVVASVGHEIGAVDYTVFAAMTSFIESHGPVIQSWISAITRAEKAVADEQPEAIAKTIESYFPGLSQDDLVSSLKRYRHYGLWKASPAISETALNTVQDMLIAEKLMKADQRLPYDRIVAPELARLSE